MGTLHIIDKLYGDKRILWEPENKKDIEKAKKTFEEKIKEGWLAYGYKKGKAIAEQLFEFSTLFERIVLQQPMVGG
jgi:hypothetical protein